MNCEILAEHLSGMVKFPTVSNSDINKIDFNVFRQFHDYLDETYPLISKTLEKKIIGHENLLYKWKGTGSTKLPVLLMAHQDVVPEGDVSKWKYPPYSGTIAEGFVWGRGSCDCKSTLMCELETIESLIAEGFVPEYDIYLAFGFNEEVQCEVKGAKEIVSYLLENKIRLGCVFDEGGIITPGKSLGYAGLLNNVRLGEKGYMDVELYCDAKGGHAMRPGKGTALGKLAKAIVAVEENPMPYRLTEVNEKYLKAIASVVSEDRKEIYSDPYGHWNELCALAGNDIGIDALLHTTCAVTMASGSLQANVLPTHASATVNCRLLQGDTCESILEHFRSVVPEGVGVRKIFGEDPQPVAEVGGPYYKLIEEIGNDMYGDRAITVPGLLPGGTDSRHYSPVCDNIFRYQGMLTDSRWITGHNINERVPYEMLTSSIDFYTEFLKRYQSAPEENFKK